MKNEKLLKLNEHPDISKYDLDKVYVFTEFPDKFSGQCNNYDKAHFENSVKNSVFLRQCRISFYIY
ncbi:hypothetical protein ABET51_15540 [Metabacillus fastidiosus]|uniref:hypothetical protein n=1 Tax=Metabacillus fastidiosus TaxID=1458 RepID=UPI002E23AA56|nr:hypothetical protein [Metabacillus fastidiosus]